MATQRCSSSLLGDELLQIFVNFVNSEAYGPTALVDAFVEIEGRRRRGGVGIGAGVGVGEGPGNGNGNGDDSLRGRAAAALATNGLSARPVEETNAPTETTTTTTAVPPPSYPFRVSKSNAGGGGALLLSASPPFLSVDRRPAGAAGLAARVGRGDDDAMASLRRLIGLWLFFHEMVRSSSLAKVSKLTSSRIHRNRLSLFRKHLHHKRRYRVARCFLLLQQARETPKRVYFYCVFASAPVAAKSSPGCPFSSHPGEATKLSCDA